MTLLSDEEVFGGSLMSDDDVFGAPKKADPKIGKPEELTFAEKYIAPVLDKLGSAVQSDRGTVGAVARTVLNDGNARGGIVGRTAMGAADPGVAMAQLAANATGQGDAVNKGIQEGEQQYQAARAEAGSTGFDPARLAGNIGMTAFMGAAAPALPGAVPAKAAIAGGSMGALQPVVDGGEHYWADKGKDVAIGAVAGPLMARLGGAVARVVSPNASTSPNLALLRKEGVEPSIGQTLGGTFNKLEEKAQSLPLVGPAIERARQRGASQLEDAAFRRVGDPIGAKIAGRGHEGIAEARGKLSEAYESVLPKLSVNVLDDAFVGKLSNLRKMVQTLPAKEAEQFDAVIAREIDGRVMPNGTLSGQGLKDAWNALRDKAKDFTGSTDAYQKDLGRAFKQAFQELKDLVAATNPAETVNALKRTDFAYANFKRLQRAASSVAAEDGRPTPAMLHNAVKALDKSKDKARFAEGDALMQDLSSAGRSVLTNKVPDSGTAGRGFMGALLTGAFTVPAVAGMAAGGVAYTRPVQNALRALVSKRPEKAPQIANELRRIMQAGGVVTVPIVEALANGR